MVWVNSQYTTIIESGEQGVGGLIYCNTAPTLIDCQIILILDYTGGWLLKYINKH